MLRYDRGTHLTDTERETHARHIAAAYRAGNSIRQIAEATGRSYGAIHRALREHGVTMRARGGANKTGKKT